MRSPCFQKNLILTSKEALLASECHGYTATMQNFRAEKEVCYREVNTFDP